MKVLDLSRVLAGPYCASLLADLGAEVIKVEMPQGGDDSRAFTPHLGGENTYFMLLNHGKKAWRSISRTSTDMPFSCAW
ncbi:Formyl-CoA:oxalate CoA-transferase [Sodalis praecaptivus]